MRDAVIAREEWIKQRQAPLLEEKKIMKQRDQLSQKAARVAMAEDRKDVVFDAPRGNQTLDDLFGDCSQLFVEHFMMGPSQGQQFGKALSFAVMRLPGARAGLIT
jgi:predicted dithiol-disulfide oxidoreductase (DUF899 family)